MKVRKFVYLLSSLLFFLFSCNHNRDNPIPSGSSSQTQNSLPPVINSFSATSVLIDGILYSSVRGNNVNTDDYNFYSSHPSVSGIGFPDGAFVQQTNPTGLNCTMAYKVQFQTNAPSFEIYTKSSSVGDFNLIVDTIQATDLPIKQGGKGGDLGYIKIDFSNSAARIITLEFYEFPFGGIKIPKGYTLTKNSFSSPRLICFGDSFTEGIYSYSMYTNWAHRLGKQLNIHDVWNSGAGGTGYLTTIPERVTFRDRISKDVLIYNPDYIFIYGGINDGTNKPADIQAEAELLYTQIFTALPHVKLIVASNHAAADLDSNSIHINDALQLACTNTKVSLFINTITGNYRKADGSVGSILINGSSSGSLLKDSNLKTYVGPDGTHPSQAGHDITAIYFANAIKESGILQ